MGRTVGVLSDGLDRAFAAVYDRVAAHAERAGLGELREELLADLEGDVVEVGAGTGGNLRHYPGGLTSLTLVEPSDPMRTRLEARVESARSDARVVEGRAESLSLPDASADHVVFTLALCSVAEPDRALAEARRVLRPHGRLHLLEHVAAPGTIGTVQRVIRPAWRIVGRGCDLRRDTEQAARSAGFDTDAIRRVTIGRLAPTPDWIVGAAPRT